MRYLILLLLFVSCEPYINYKEDGTPYSVDKRCFTSHKVSHWNYQLRTVVFEDVCDSFAYDTTYINREDQPIQ